MASNDPPPAHSPISPLTPLSNANPATHPAPLMSPIPQSPALEPPRALKPRSPTHDRAERLHIRLISRAQAKLDNGRFLEARAELNDALQSGALGESQTASVKALISQISQTVVFGPRRFRR